MRSILEIRLFGGFRLGDGSHDGLPRKARALLAHLAMNPGKAIPRERLADLLWSTSGPEQARQSLRQSLAAVRRVFEQTSRNPIVTIGPDVMLEPSDAVEVDAHRFEALARSNAPADLAGASELYRGSFLAGFDIPSEPFLEWVQVERARLESIATKMLRRLAALSRDAGDHDAAAAAAQRLVALDPLDEQGHRFLMELYAVTGRRIEAIRQFATLSDNLRRELNVAPDKTTVALAQAIKADASMPPLQAFSDATQGEVAAALANVEASASALPDSCGSIRQVEESATPVGSSAGRALDRGNGEKIPVAASNGADVWHFPATAATRHARPERRMNARMARMLAVGSLLTVCSAAAGAGIWHMGQVRFDGNWDVTLVCPTDSLAHGYTLFIFMAQVKNGNLHGQHGTVGQPRWLANDGPIRSDGIATLNARGLTNDPANSPFQPKPGTAYFYTIEARFNGVQGGGKRVELRPCTFTFHRVGSNV